MATMEDVFTIFEQFGFQYANNPVDENLAVFEGQSALGFVLKFENVPNLIDTWDSRLDQALKEYQLALKRSGTKSWNAYAVLLTEGEATHEQKIALQSIEENLIGTRKIVRSGVNTKQDILQAMLPLLPIQSHPKLPVVNLTEEIRMRTTELPDEALNALFSDASDLIAVQVIEEAQ